MGGSRPNQNDYVFSVILVAHRKSYIETTDRRDIVRDVQDGVIH